MYLLLARFVNIAIVIIDVAPTLSLVLGPVFDLTIPAAVSLTVTPKNAKLVSLINKSLYSFDYTVLAHLEHLFFASGNLQTTQQVLLAFPSF